MADNVILPGTAEIVAADELAGAVKVQRTKVGWGPDGTNNDTDVASGKPLPVQVRSATGLIPIGEPTDGKNAATDTTSVSLISLVKQLSEYLAPLATHLTALQLIDDTIFVDDADWTALTSKHNLIGGIYQATPGTVTDGDTGPIRLTSRGLLALGVDPEGWITKTFTPSCVTGAQTAEDIVFATEEIATVGLANGQLIALHQIVVTDIDDQGDAQTLFFFSENTSLGTEGSIPDIDDTEILTCIGQAAIATGDWKDVGANRVATVRYNPPILLRLGASTSLWVAGNTQGTPTHTASGLRYRFTFERR